MSNLMKVVAGTGGWGLALEGHSSPISPPERKGGESQEKN